MTTTAQSLDTLALAQLRVVLSARLDHPAWQRALARLRHAVEQDDTAPAQPEDACPEAEEALP